MSLTLKPGPRLYVEVTPFPGESSTSMEITSSAHEYLHELVTLDDVKLIDIANLVRENPILRAVLASFCIDEILEEMQKGPEPYQGDSYSLDFLEISQDATVDSYTGEYLSQTAPSMQGMGRVPELDDPADPSSLMGWSVSFVPVRQMLTTKVRINPIFTTYEGDKAKASYGDVLRIEKSPGITLLQLLTAIFEELSFFGPPDMQGDIKDSLSNLHVDYGSDADELPDTLSDDILDAAAETESPLTNLLITDLSPTEFKFYFYSASNKASERDLVNAIFRADDDVDLVEHLIFSFGEHSFKIKEEFAGLSAYEARRLYYNHIATR